MSATIITGASGALGRELAIQFSYTGHVILSGRDIPRLEETRMLCAGTTTSIAGDLKDASVRERLVSAGDTFQVNRLVLCAGARHSVDIRLQNSTKIYDVMQSNLLTNQVLISDLYPILHNGASIIHVNSAAGRNLAAPEEAVYSASKHGMAAFLRSLRLEARLDGISVLDVFLGAMKTPMMVGRADYENLIEPREAAAIIFANACWASQTLQIDEITIGRSKFQ